MSETSNHLTFFEQRRERFSALLELSQRQRSLIQNDDYDGLLAVLGRKQGILAELGQTKADADQRIRSWRDDRVRLDSAHRDECEAVLAETESLVAEIVHEEDACTRSLAERRDSTRRELDTIDRGARTNNAYRDTLAPTTHRHLDIDT